MEQTKLSRQQRRIQERANIEIGNMHAKIAKEFFDFFMSCDDPESEEVKSKMKHVDAKWRLFCKRADLLPKAYPLMREYMDKLIADYKAEKDAN